MKGLHFLVVCTFGAGSSLMLRMNVEKILGEMGCNDAIVEVSDMGGCKGRPNISAFLCSIVLQDNLKSQVPDQTVIGIKNFYDKDELTQALLPFVKP